MADSVDLWFFPVPDGVGASCTQTADICACDRIDACALAATGCLEGCSGPSALELIRFVSCFEGSSSEGSCSPSKKNGCAASSGTAAATMQACLANTTEVVAVQARIQAASDNIRMYPSVHLDGRATLAQTDAALAKALCAKGVTGAC